MTTSAGIHHITAICGDPQRHVDFYAGLLGLRLVKRTVNFDAPTSYHLYFGDERGRPGTILTFFAWGGGAPGTHGVGQVSTVGFAAPAGSLAAWEERLSEHGVAVAEERHFDTDVLTFADPDGVQLEIVASEDADPDRAWTGGAVREDLALRGVHHATLALDVRDGTQHVLEDVFGFQEVAEDGARVRLAGPKGTGSLVDLVESPHLPVGLVARGTVHHIAFRARDGEAQAAMRREAQGFGLQTTHVLDRQYFRSVYFREPGGILFEIATDEPGFLVDEDEASLGETLKLPPWLEPSRRQIEAGLPALGPAREPDRVEA